jgi:O-antigen/teichoic acid export membrane protein
MKMQTEINNKLIWGSFYQYFASLYLFAFQAITTIYILKKLSIYEYGFFNWSLSIIAFVQLITSLGLDQALQRYLPEFDVKNEINLKIELVRVLLFIRIIAVIFCAIILISTRYKLIRFFDFPVNNANYVIIIAVILGFELISNMLGDTVLVTLFENKYWSLSKLIYSTVKFLSLIAAVTFNYGLYGVFISLAFSEAVLFFLYFFRVNSLLHISYIGIFNQIILPLRKIFSFSIFLFFQQCAWFLRDKASDILFLSYFCGAGEVAVYSVAYGIPLLLQNLTPASRLRSLLTAYLVRKHIQNNQQNEMLKLYFIVVSKITFFIMVPVFSYLILFSPEIIEYLLDSKYVNAGNLMRLASSFLMIRIFVYSYSAIIYALEQSKMLLIGSFSAVYNLIANFVLIPKFGAFGAILATGSAGVLPILYYHISLKRNIIALSYPWRAFMIFLINVVVSLIIAFSCKSFVTGTTSLLISFILFMSFYLFACFLNKGFSNTDRELINNIIAKRLWIF